jgi:hypothetical protein
VQRVAGASSRAVKVVAGDAVVKRLSLLNVYVKNQDSAIEFYTNKHPFFGIVTDDCVAEYRRMKNAGVRFHGEREVQPYGTGVTLEDLYGNKIYLNQEPAGPLAD